ncbi:MAG TPA: hypothetical protein VNT52_06560 [Acidimicrobiales bacterium]|jgi:hypothetical protein|nr:hypothetical protein [Acidimicrobiales bacterium]
MTEEEAMCDVHCWLGVRRCSPAVRRCRSEELLRGGTQYEPVGAAAVPTDISSDVCCHTAALPKGALATIQLSVKVVA